MEKRKLTQEELDQLNDQYYELKKTLKEYRDGMRSKNYRSMFDKQQRDQIELQYGFFKKCINETLITLMDQDGLKTTTAIDAIWNRFVGFVTKWRVSRYLRRK